MIKLLESDDYSTLVSIWEKSVVETHHFLYEEDFIFYKSVINEYLPKSKIYIFEESDITKGFLGVSDTEIDMLFVSPEYFGQGVGKSLLLYAIDELKLTKVDVNEQNIKAYNFYKYFGFVDVGRDETDAFGKSYPIVHLELF